MPNELSVVNEILVSLLQIDVSWIIVLHLDPHTENLNYIIILI
jgi:hypothetical protein